MAKEIERKFLVSDTSIIDKCDRSVYIRQAYLSDRPESTVRVRIFGEQAFITIKSKNIGISRHEWEYEIPLKDAREILEKCHTTGTIEKTRYICGRWEIDIFHGRLEGLALAEIEMHDADEQIELPAFIGKEVSGDNRYFNSCLAATQTPPPFD